MTSPLDRDPIRIQNLPRHNEKQQVEDDARNVPINLSSSSSSLDLNTDVLSNQLSLSIDAVKNESKSKFSKVLKTGKGYFRSFFPKKPVEKSISINSIAQEDLQPTILQRPRLERPGHHAQSSTQKLIQQSKNTGAINLPKIARGFSSEAALMKAIYAVMGKQVELFQTNTTTNQALIEANGVKHQRLMDKYTEFRDRGEKRKEVAEIFSWTGWGAGLLATVFTIGGAIAAASASGGGTVFMSMAASLASLASGGSQVASGILKHKGELDKAQAFETKQDIGMITNSTSNALQDMEANDNGLVSIMAKCAQLLRNEPHPFRN